MSYWTKDNETYVIEHGMVFVPGKADAKTPGEVTYEEEEIYHIYILKKNSLTLYFDTTKKTGGDAQVNGLKAMINVI